MAKADKQKRLKMAAALLGTGAGKNEAARQIAKRFRLSLDSAKNDVRQAAAAAAAAAAPDEAARELPLQAAPQVRDAPPQVRDAPPQAQAAPPAGEESGDGYSLRMLRKIEAGEMPSILEINTAVNLKLLQIMLNAAYEKDRIAAARALSKNFGLDSPELRSWVAEMKKAADPAGKRREILAALGLAPKEPKG